MADISPSRPDQPAAEGRLPPPPPPVSKCQIANSILFGLLVGFGGILIGILFLVQTPGGGSTCDVGTSKYDSFDAWGGRLGIQKDGGNCTSDEGKCVAEFSFSRGSIFMSRGCLSEEITKTMKEGPLLWTLNTTFWDPVGFECFVRKEDDTTLSCLTTTTKQEGRTIPSNFFEEFRKALCLSTQIKRPWINWVLPFITSRRGLPCPSSTQEQGGSSLSSGKPLFGSFFGVKKGAEVQMWWKSTMRKIVEAMSSVNWGSTSMINWGEGNNSVCQSNDIHIRANGLGGSSYVKGKKVMELRIRLHKEGVHSTSTKGGKIEVRVGKTHSVSVTIPKWVRVEELRIEEVGRELVFRWP